VRKTAPFRAAAGWCPRGTPGRCSGPGPNMHCVTICPVRQVLCGARPRGTTLM